MTMREEILAAAKAVCGAADEEEALLERLCDAAGDEVAARLRGGLTAEDCGGAFVCAAAWIAAAALEGARSGGALCSSLRAGDLTLTLPSAQERAQRSRLLRRQAWDLMAPYLGDGTFCFRAVAE